MRGDGRLNNKTQSQKTNLQTFPALVSASRSSTFFVLESFDLRSPRGGRTNLGQPITTVRLDGVSPGRVGFRVPKELAGCLAYRASGEPPPAMCPAYHARRQRYTVTCSCANRYLMTQSLLGTISPDSSDSHKESCLPSHLV
jgi:hypothetical protein